MEGFCGVSYSLKALGLSWGVMRKCLSFQASGGKNKQNKVIFTHTQAQIQVDSEVIYQY